MAYKFKVGDKVRTIKEVGDCPINVRGEILEVKKGKRLPYYTAFDNPHYNDFFGASELEKVEEGK